MHHPVVLLAVMVWSLMLLLLLVIPSQPSILREDTLAVSLFMFIGCSILSPMIAPVVGTIGHISTFILWLVSLWNVLYVMSNTSNVYRQYVLAFTIVSASGFFLTMFLTLFKTCVVLTVASIVFFITNYKNIELSTLILLTIVYVFLHSMVFQHHKGSLLYVFFRPITTTFDLINKIL
jgi:hypothetical protein